MGHSVNGLLERLNRQSRELDSIYYSIALRIGLSENAFRVLYILSDTTRQYSQQDICEPDLPPAYHPVPDVLPHALHAAC